MQKGHGIADEDAPHDPESTRFWCWVGGKYTDRERTTLSMEATSHVKATAESLGSMLSSSGISQLSIANGASDGPCDVKSGPSLEALVGVMNQANPKAKAKAAVKCKAKAKARASVQTPKTPAEQRESIRSLIWISTGFVFLDCI